MRPLYHFLVIFLILFSVSSSAASRLKSIKLHVGSVKTLAVGDVVRVAVGRDQILGTSILDNGELLLIPKEAGETDLHIWKKGERKLSYRVSITAANMRQQVRTIKNVMRSFRNIEVRDYNGIVIVEGKVDPKKYDMFQGTLSQFPGVVSLVEPEDVVIKDMIRLSVQVLEVNKNYAKNLGIKWDRAIAGPTVSYLQHFNPNRRYMTINEASGFDPDDVAAAIGFNSASGYTYTGIATSIMSQINILQEDGAARTLAEPSLSTRSGEAATFHSGGEYPLAVLNEFGQPVVEMQDYGVQLDIEPMSDENGNIISKISAEMSTIDFSTIVNGVPGLLKRKTESVVNLKSGETIAISGLLQSSDSKAVEKMPFLGDIPILGELFKSKNFSENRTELIILVTPHIVKPDSAVPEKLRRHIESLRKVKEQSDIEDELLD
ncbi:type II and III secretion system protein family protein [Pleionea sp. CnH1-48]|uniref:type II and III secretion system protein family protein n=1 Tax=Pleionea sp. CnH1-48 TaxID=2954494 RepID=UPI00209712EF|nr:pilus assembly protein N-terminal domain-containing protein [Pleionea sp. CnH1-48]MCO7223839.1 pilus assembly protein N-terminal domain-containing protein [Pleionea sp. CnH1-48]